MTRDDVGAQHRPILNITSGEAPGERVELDLQRSVLSPGEDEHLAPVSKYGGVIIGFVSVRALRFQRGPVAFSSARERLELCTASGSAFAVTQESEVSDMGVGIGPAAAIGTAMIPVGTALTGCADLSAIDKDCKDLQAQLNQVSSDVVAMKSSLDKATEASRQAKEAADNAASTANQALAIAQSAQRSVEATNARLERLSPDHCSK
jgi:outer membrane murein-binding lipoprotein Lpp